MEKRWTAKNGVIFNPLGEIHYDTQNVKMAEKWVRTLNWDMDKRVPQTWMPGISEFKEDILNPHRLKGFFKKGA